jgi:hypothetical protein
MPHEESVAVEVFDRPCYGCPFSATSIVSPARVRDIRRGCVRDDRHFVCHKSTSTMNLTPGRQVVCGGYWRAVYLKTGAGQWLRIAQRLRLVRLVPVPPEADAEARRLLVPWKMQRRRRPPPRGT